MPGSLVLENSRASELARLLGHVTGGRPAERLLHRLGIPQSDDTVVRIVNRGAASRNKPALRVAGMDDWSWHQGRSYGTIVVDLERRQDRFHLLKNLRETI